MIKMDYSKLRGKIKEKNMTQKEVAAYIGVSDTHFSKKLMSKYAFTQNEILKMCELFDITDQEIRIYFFTPEVEVSQHIRNKKVH